MFALLELNKTNGTGVAIVSLFLSPCTGRWWWAVLCHTPQLRDISDICIPGLWRRRGALSAGVTREKVPGRAAAERRRREGTKARPRIFISLFFCRPGGGVKHRGHPDINIHHHQHQQSGRGSDLGVRCVLPLPRPKLFTLRSIWNCEAGIQDGFAIKNL